VKTLKQRVCSHLFVNAQTRTCSHCGLVGAQQAPFTEATLRAKRRANKKLERAFLKEHR
jgi:hypothetical protein